MNLRRSISLWLGGLFTGIGVLLAAINFVQHNPSQYIVAGGLVCLSGVMLTLMGTLLR